MKTHSRKHHVTLGEFIASAYNTFGKRKGRGVVRLAIKAHLIQFERAHVL